jgi:hypothetical protein
MFLGRGGLAPVGGGDVDYCDGGGAWVCGRGFIECLVVNGEFEERVALRGGAGGLLLGGGLLRLWLLLGNGCVGFGCWDLVVSLLVEGEETFATTVVFEAV